MTSTTTTTTLPLRPGTWTLDPLHSTVGFTIRHLGISKVRGTFSDFDVTVAVGETLADTSVEAVVQTASIDTGNKDRDDHVRSADLLDVERRPSMAFRSTSISGAGDEWALEGELTIGDVTRPITLDVELGGLQLHPGDGRHHAGFEARGELRRKDFGVDFGTMFEAGLGQVIKIELDLQLLEPDA
jgi:polyisoprenoid-binding protein YceI